jgi:hypothetical protein
LRESVGETEQIRIVYRVLRPQDGILRLAEKGRVQCDGQYGFRDLEPATKFGGPRRADYGGSWNGVSSYLLGSTASDSQVPDTYDAYMGFRVAMVPEPASGAMLLTVGAMALIHRRRQIKSYV